MSGLYRRRLLAGLFFFGSILTCSSGVYAQSPEERAEDAVSGVSGNFTDPEALTDNLLTPMTTDSPLATFSGEGFNAQVACDATDEFLNIFIAPGGTGDISTFTISQDTDFNGSADTNMSLPFVVSGVCANGVVSCSPGTWSSCQAYRWSVSGSGAVSAAPVSLEELGGCYAVNNSAGSNLVLNNIDQVMGDLGGGISGAIMRARPGWAVSRVNQTGPNIRFAAQNTESCNAGGAGAFSGPTPSGLEDYFSSPTTMVADASSAAGSNDLYDAVTSGAGAGAGTTSHACSVSRSVSLQEITANEIIRVTSASAPMTTAPCPGDEDCFTFEIGRDYDLAKTCNHVAQTISLEVGYPEHVTEAVITSVQWDDWQKVKINGTTIISDPVGWSESATSCETGSVKTSNPNRSFRDRLTVGSNSLQGQLAVYHRGNLYVEGRIRYTIPPCDTEDVITDTCGSYAGNSVCRLITETVDGVPTVEDYLPTGLTPLPQNITLTGVTCTVNEGREWLVRERVYACEGADGPSSRFDLGRVSYVYDNASMTGFGDIVEDEDGSKSTVTGSLSVYDNISVDSCQKSCKTSLNTQRTAVGGSGPVSNYQTSSNSPQFAFKACSLEGVCPLEAGETILEDCACLNSFPEAASLLQAVRLASDDQVCTSGDLSEPE